LVEHEIGGAADGSRDRSDAGGAARDPQYVATR
jgi:hypothetical protein